MIADKKAILDKLEASERDVDEAEKHLLKVLADTVSAPRADKTTITEAVSEAIAKLRAARADLEELGRLVKAE